MIQWVWQATNWWSDSQGAPITANPFSFTASSTSPYIFTERHSVPSKLLHLSVRKSSWMLFICFCHPTSLLINISTAAVVSFLLEQISCTIKIIPIWHQINFYGLVRSFYHILAYCRLGLVVGLSEIIQLVLDELNLETTGRFVTVDRSGDCPKEFAPGWKTSNLVFKILSIIQIIENININQCNI